VFFRELSLLDCCFEGVSGRRDGGVTDVELIEGVLGEWNTSYVI
jgi:hypothetical protein